VYQPSTPVRVLLEKSKGLCRQLVIPDPVDALFLQSMVNAILPAVLRNQPNRNAFYQAQSHKFSKTRSERISESEYGSLQSWLAFQKAVFKFTKLHKYLIVTDVANFFDYVDFRELRSIYGSFDGVNEDVLDFIFFILGNYNWQPDYMPDRNVGLPQMNFDAPRLLAHSFLFELDSYLTKVAIGSYARYMDDMDIGVASVGEAKKILRDVDLVLQSRGVRLNSGKTNIMTSAEAMVHYFVKDNLSLDMVERAIERKILKFPLMPRSTLVKRELNFLTSKLVKSFATDGYFNHGNGDKVLKRYLTLSIKYGFAIDDATSQAIIFLRPSLREYAMRCLCFYGYTLKRYEIIRNYLLSGHCIDDASVFAGAKAIVDFNCPNTIALKSDVRSLAADLSRRGKVGLTAALWLLSKYGTQKELIALIKDFMPVWSTDNWVGRQVGALYPRFKGNPTIFAKFLSLVRSSRNGGTQSTYILHRAMMRNDAPFSHIYSYLKAKTPSQPRGITHQKILLFLTFMRSPANTTLKQNLKNVYNSWQLDAVQKYLLRSVL
jgi:hypothetical protein